MRRNSIHAEAIASHDPRNSAYGASAVPAEWRRMLHGWPGLRTRDLVALSTRIVQLDKLFSYDIDPITPVRHPHDDGVWLADIAALRTLPRGVDAVVSLCRVNDDDLPMGVEQVDIRLIDKIEPDANPNLDFVLTDTVRLIEQLRNEGRTVLLHCVACQSRTPTVAALYGAHRQGLSGMLALQDITSVLPDVWPNSDFRKAVETISTITVVLFDFDAWNHDRQQSEVSLAKGEAALVRLVDWFLN